MSNLSLIFFQRIEKEPHFSSKFYPINNQQRKHLKPLSGYVHDFFISQVHKYNTDQKKQNLICLMLNSN